ncbi:MAG: hypothetical protein RIC03_01620 [Cyclobacteriaceae bacterium]
MDSSWYSLKQVKRVNLERLSDQNQIEIFQMADGQSEVQVRFKKETVWLSQDQLSGLFDRDRTVNGLHIRNELFEQLVSTDFTHTTKHG